MSDKNTTKKDTISNIISEHVHIFAPDETIDVSSSGYSLKYDDKMHQYVNMLAKESINEVKPSKKPLTDEEIEIRNNSLVTKEKVMSELVKVMKELKGGEEYLNEDNYEILKNSTDWESYNFELFGKKFVAINNIDGFLTIMVKEFNLPNIVYNESFDSINFEQSAPIFAKFRNNIWYSANVDSLSKEFPRLSAFCELVSAYINYNKK